MNVKLIIVILCLFTGLFVPDVLFAQRTTVTGTAPGAERKTIRVSTYGDLLTFWEKPLATARIDSTGHFSLIMDLERTANAVFSIDFHKAELYLEPAKAYTIRIDPLEYDQFQEVNPFIRSQNLTLELIGSDAEELNALIGTFNSFYSGFLMENFNALYRERRKILLDTFRVQMNRLFGEATNPFFKDYAAYKIASLEQLSQYYNKAQLAARYFTDKPVLYENPEYMDLFNTFFAKYLTGTSMALRKTDYHSLFRATDPYKAFLKALSADTVLKNEQFREMVMLKGLMEMHSIPDYSPEDVLTLVSIVAETSKFPENRVVASDLVNLLTKLKPGTKAPEFTLRNRDQKEVSLKSMLGKPVVLGFWTTYCEGCLSEMDLLKPLYDKYQVNVHFVSISADKYFTKMLFFINLKQDYVWQFLHIGDQTEVLKDYDVRSYPLFVLIDEKGSIVKYPAGLPSSGLEAEIQKILE